MDPLIGGTDRFARLVPLLQCPACCGPLRFEGANAGASLGVFGVLCCSCSEYPVVDSIPIFLSRRISVYEHTTGRAETEGVSPKAILGLIRSGQCRQALVECLTMPLPGGLFDRLPFWSFWHGPLIRNIGRRLRRFQLNRQLNQPNSLQTAKVWLGVFFGKYSPAGGDLFSYFFYRFGQPRDVAALTLLSVFRPAAKPILDFACGFGHLSHYLTSGLEAHDVIGADLNFFTIWAARRTVAPRASFVCAEADRPLPFRNAAFSGVLCSDAFHYFADKQLAISEFRRCTDAGPLILTRVGNSLILPNEGKELSPEKYAELLGPVRTSVFGEAELINRYQSRQSPAFDRDRTPNECDNDKWLSFVQLPDQYPSPVRQVAEWPHRAGAPRINPIYLQTPRPDGGCQLRLTFPSTWYAAENGSMLAYLPREVSLTAEDVQAVHSGQPSSTIDRLIDAFVLWGMPENYG